jgi:hypothetical protein
VANNWADKDFIIDIDAIENLTFNELGCAAKILSALLHEEKENVMPPPKNDDEEEE